MSGAPTGSTFDPVSGLFAWTVPPNQPLGDYPIGVTVTDNGSPPMSASETFTIDVVPFNHPPVVSAIPLQTVDEGNPLTVDATATDPDAGQTLTYSLGPGALAGAAIGASSGVFTWTSDPYAGSGNYSITVVATDNGPIPKSGSVTFMVDVLAVNHPPVVPAAIPVQVVSPGQTLQFGVAGYASDPDRPAQTLTYSLAPGDPAGAQHRPGLGPLHLDPAPEPAHRGLFVRRGRDRQRLAPAQPDGELRGRRGRRRAGCGHHQGAGKHQTRPHDRTAVLAAPRRLRGGRPRRLHPGPGEEEVEEGPCPGEHPPGA